MLNLTPASPPTLLSLDTQPSLRPEDVDRRAELIHYGIQEGPFRESTKDLARIRDALGAQLEDRYRANLADEKALTLRSDRIQAAELEAQTYAASGQELPPTFFTDNFGLDISPDPTFIVEEETAQRIRTDTTRATGDEFDFGEFDPDTININKATARQVFEEIQSQYDNASWGRWGRNFVASILPFTTAGNMMESFEKITGRERISFLPGSTIEDQVSAMYLMNPEEFRTNLRRAANELADHNIVDAMSFMTAVIRFSESDKFWNNAFQALDVADLATLGASTATGIAANAARRARHVRKLRDISTAVGNPVNTVDDIEVIRNAPGDFENVARRKATSAASEVLEGEKSRLDMLTETVPSGLDPKSYLRSASSITGAQQQRFIDSLTRTGAALDDSLVGVDNVIRLDERATETALIEASRRFRVEYKNIEDFIVDTRYVAEAAEEFAGADKIRFYIGSPDSRPFKSSEQADFFARNDYKLAPGGYEIEEVDGGVYLTITKTVDETANAVMTTRISNENATKQSAVNNFLGLLRSPSTYLGEGAKAARVDATFSGQAALTRIAEALEPLGKLSKGRSERLGAVIDEAKFLPRTVVDPDGTERSIRGRFYHTVDDFQEAYSQRFGYNASEQEVTAYFTFRKFMDHDYHVRNAQIVVDKARLGIDQKRILIQSHPDTGGPVHTKFFEGRVQESLPERQTEFGLAWVDADKGVPKFGLSTRMFGSEWDSVQELLSSGDYKILQVFNPLDDNLRKVFNTGGEGIEYIVVRDVQSRPLGLKQLAYNEGGHWDYADNIFLKVPATVRTRYGRRIHSGDMTLHSFSNVEDAKQFKASYEEAMRIFKEEGMSERLGEYVTRNLGFENAEDFASRVKTAENSGGILDFDTPFVITSNGNTIDDLTDLSAHYGEPITRTSGMQRDVYSRYAQERGEPITNVKQIGSEANPVFSQSRSQLIDGMEGIRRNAAELARSRGFEDYKRKVIEEHFQEFADVYDSDFATLMRDPVGFLRNPRYREGLADIELTKRNAAALSRRSIMHLIGEESPDVRGLKRAIQSVADTMPGKGKGLKFLNPRDWDNTKDPTAVIRSAVFHPIIGLFNVTQAALQSSAIITIAGIDGNIPRVTKAAMMYPVLRMRRAVNNNNAVRSMTKAYGKAAGEDAGLLDEVYEAWVRSGWDQTTGAHNMLDDYLNPNMVHRTGFGRFLDAGTFFFREGNGVHSGTSFITSYLRWKDLNPGKVPNTRDLSRIKTYANRLYLDMSRAGNPDWQRGFASIPTQFWGFSQRYMEEALGGLFRAEDRMSALRVTAINSTAFGIPVGLAGAVSLLWPVQDSIRQTMFEQGIEGDESVWTDLAVNGGLSVALKQWTDESFDFGRYGPEGWDTFRSLIRDGDLSVLGGPALSQLTDAVAAVEPIYMAAVDVFNPNEEEAFELNWGDFQNVFRELSSVNTAVAAWMVYNTGEYASVRGTSLYTGEEGDAAAALATLMGLTPREVSDAFIRLRRNQDVREKQRAVERLALQEFRRALKAGQQKDEDLFMQHMKRARVIMVSGGFDAQEMAAVRARAMSENANLVESVRESFMEVDPVNRLQDYREFRREQLERRMENRN